MVKKSEIFELGNMDNFDRLEHFYKKNGFNVILDEDRTSENDT